MAEGGVKEENEMSSTDESSKKPEKRFTSYIAKFYDIFFCNLSESVGKLAEIEEKFPKEYKVIKDMQTDPTTLIKAIPNLTAEEMGILLGMFVKAADFEKRMLKLFDLSLEEKKNLMNDLKGFAQELEAYVKKDEK